MLLIWVLVEPQEGWESSSALHEERGFRIVPTGGDAGKLRAVAHLTTVFTAGGNLVWHVFDA